MWEGEGGDRKKERGKEQEWRGVGWKDGGENLNHLERNKVSGEV